VSKPNKKELLELFTAQNRYVKEIDEDLQHLIEKAGAKLKDLRKHPGGKTSELTVKALERLLEVCEVVSSNPMMRDHAGRELAYQNRVVGWLAQAVRMGRDAQITWEKAKQARGTKIDEKLDAELCKKYDLIIKDFPDLKPTAASNVVARKYNILHKTAIEQQNTKKIGRKSVQGALKRRSKKTRAGRTTGQP
jgi:hypothetical protein